MAFILRFDRCITDADFLDMGVHINLQTRQLLSYGLLLFWLLGTAYAFWWFQFKDLRPFTSLSTTNKSIFFDGEQLQSQLRQLLPDDKEAPQNPAINTTVIHFWDPACNCSRFNEQHVRQLMKQYRRQGIRFVVAARPDSFADLRTLRERARVVFGEVEVVSSEGVLLNRTIPSSPAAIILDGQQRLAYFGPYSEGAVCSVGGGRFVERILDRVLKGDNPQFINTLAYGCFCDWQKTAKQI